MPWSWNGPEIFGLQASSGISNKAWVFLGTGLMYYGLNFRPGLTDLGPGPFQL